MLRDSYNYEKLWAELNCANLIFIEVKKKSDCTLQTRSATTTQPGLAYVQTLNGQKKKRAQQKYFNCFFPAAYTETLSAAVFMMLKNAEIQAEIVLR